jgi:two-component system LytT family response regulator
MQAMRERLHNPPGTSIALVSAPPAMRAPDAGKDRSPGPANDEPLARALARLQRQLAVAAPRDGHLHRLLARVGDRLTMVDLEPVDWIEAADYFVCLHVGAASHLVRRTLGGIEHQLDPTRFFRLDRFAIVNLAHVAEVRPDGRGEPTAVLANGTVLRMGRGRLEALRRRLAAETAARRRA